MQNTTRPTQIYFHGTPAETVVQIMKSGLLKPNKDGKIFLARFEWTSCLPYGVHETVRRRSCVIKVALEMPNEGTRILCETPGARDTAVITTSSAIPARVLELYVRTLSPEGSDQPARLEHFTGEEVIRRYLSSIVP